MRGIAHHIILSVSDLETAAPFYDAVLVFMGYEREPHGGGPASWTLQGDGIASNIGLRQAERSTPHDRYAPGLHHLAWTADSSADVDRLHELLRKIGAAILDPPAEYPRYNRGRGYYAVFFADPDGLKLEYVFRPRSE